MGNTGGKGEEHIVKIHDHCTKLCETIRRIGFIPINMYRNENEEFFNIFGETECEFVNNAMEKVRNIVNIVYMGSHTNFEDGYACYFLITDADNGKFLLKIIIHDTPKTKSNLKFPFLKKVSSSITVDMLYNVLTIKEEGDSTIILGEQDTRYLCCKFNGSEMSGVMYDSFYHDRIQKMIVCIIIFIKDGFITDFVLYCRNNLVRTINPVGLNGTKKNYDCCFWSLAEHRNRMIINVNPQGYTDESIHIFNKHLSTYLNNTTFISFVINAISMVYGEFANALENISLDVSKLRKGIHSVVIRNECDEILKTIDILRENEFQCKNIIDDEHDCKQSDLACFSKQGEHGCKQPYSAFPLGNGEPLPILLLRAVIYEHSLMLYRRLTQI